MELHKIYDIAVEKYRAGERGAKSFFNKKETADLKSIGLQPVHVYDYAEDFINHGEPDWDTFLLVASVRRDYFLYEMKSAKSDRNIIGDDLPSKTDALDGVVWLPRILEKAQCFLEGELCPDIMYGCGGDRNFLKKHHLHAADFLRAVWGAKGDAEKVLKFVSTAGTA